MQRRLRNEKIKKNLLLPHPKGMVHYDPYKAEVFVGTLTIDGRLNEHEDEDCKGLRPLNT